MPEERLWDSASLLPGQQIPCPFLFLLEPLRHCPSELLGTEAWRLLWSQPSNTEHPSINRKQQGLSARPFFGVFEGHILHGHLFPFTSLDNVTFFQAQDSPSLSSPLPSPFPHSGFLLSPIPLLPHTVKVMSPKVTPSTPEQFVTTVGFEFLFRNPFEVRECLSL